MRIITSNNNTFKFESTYALQYLKIKKKQKKRTSIYLLIVVQKKKKKKNSTITHTHTHTSLFMSCLALPLTSRKRGSEHSPQTPLIYLFMRFWFFFGNHNFNSFLLKNWCSIPHSFSFFFILFISFLNVFIFQFCPSFLFFTS